MARGGVGLQADVRVCAVTLLAGCWQREIKLLAVTKVNHWGQGQSDMVPVVMGVALGGRKGADYPGSLH